MFYLDMFPREGKFNHFAEFEIIGGKLLPDGKYQRPTVALLCNFPPPSADKPSLLTHTDVETLFHEFGHALHAIVTRAKYARFAGHECARRFRRSAFADAAELGLGQEGARYFRRRLPRSDEEDSGGDRSQKMKDAKLATVGVYYRRQFAFASLDLALHDAASGGSTLRLRGHFKSDPGEGFPADRSETPPSSPTSDISTATTPAITVMPGRMRSPPIWRRFSKKRKTVTSTKKRECACATKSTRRAIRASLRIDREISRPKTIDPAVPENRSGSRRRRKKAPAGPSQNKGNVGSLTEPAAEILQACILGGESNAPSNIIRVECNWTRQAVANRPDLDRKKMDVHDAIAHVLERR